MILSGPGIDGDLVSLGPVTLAEVHEIPADEVAGSSMGWVDQAAVDDSILYFGIYQNARLVGQIFLHDISEDRGETLIGYHLFAQHDRGRGFGTAALQLLISYLERSTTLVRAIVITSRDNVASRRMALACGFVDQGAPREDPVGVLLARPLFTTRAGQRPRSSSA